MAKRKLNIKGNTDFLFIAVFCGFICIWSIRDAWFPTKNTLKKHPREIPVAFTIPGVVKEIPVKVGDEIRGKTLLASLYDEAHQTKVAEAQAEFEAAKAAHHPAWEEKQQAWRKAQDALEACTVENTDIVWTSSHGEEVLYGIVKQILTPPSTPIQAGQGVLTIAPRDTFYLFNRSLSLLMFIGAIIALVFHRMASR